MEEQSQQDPDGAGLSVKEEEVENDDLTEMAALDAEEEDEEALPHSEILDIFEEGLARLVQDPLLCDLPIQVGLTCLSVCLYALSCYQWWNVNKYIYSSTVLKYNFEVLVHYFRISISCFFIFLLHYILW